MDTSQDVFYPTFPPTQVLAFKRPPMNVLSRVNVGVPTFETCDKWFPVGVRPVWSIFKCMRSVRIREPNGLRFATRVFAGYDRAQVHNEVRFCLPAIWHIKASYENEPFSEPA